MKNLSTKLKIQVKQKQQNKQTYSIADTYLNINILKTVYCFIAHSKLLKNIALNRLTVPRNKSKVKIFQLIFNLFSSLNPAGNIIATPTQPAARFIKKSAKLVSIIPSIALCYVFFLSLSTPVFAGELTNQFTVSIWVKPETSIASKALVVKDSEIRLVTDASGNPLCQIYASGAWQTAVTSSTALSLNSWANVACTYNKANIYVYVNGVQTGSGVQTNSVNDAATNLLTGQDDSGTYGNFIGTTDQLEVYNYARTQKQVIEDMGGGHPAVTASSTTLSSSSSTGGSRAGGPVGYWKFDEGYGTTAHNSGSQGETLQGSLSGFASPATTTSGWTQAGKFNKGLVFDGTDDYVNGTTNAILNITGAITLSAWIKPTDLTSYHSIAAKSGGNTNNTQYELRTNGTTLEFTITNTGASQYTASYASGLSTGTWYHVVGWFDGTTLKTFINGVQSNTTATFSGTQSTSTEAFTIGTRAITGHSPGQIFFTGSIDEPKIYPYALTADEVKLDYNRGAAQVLGALSDTNSLNTSQPNSAASEYCVPGDTTSTSCAAPVGRWDFDEGTGTSANDTSGNAVTGTLSAPTYKTGKTGKGLSFNGSSDSVTFTNTISGVKTVSFWVNPTTTTQYFMDLDGGTHYISASSGTVSATNFTSPTIYVNGVSGGTITANTWNHIEITTNTAFNTTSSMTFGKSGSNYLNGKLDNVRIFNYARSAAQIAWDYNRGAPVGHWKFDECQGTTAHDSSGNSNHGTLTVGASGTQTSVGTCTGSANTSWKDGATGKFNSSLDFDGSDDYVAYSDISTFDFGATSDFAVGAWIKTTSTSQQTAVAKYNSAGTIGWQLSNVGGGGKIDLYIDNTNCEPSVKSVVDINNGSWHHIVGVRDTSGTRLLLYVDGKLSNSGSISTCDVSNDGMLAIGRAGSATVNYFNGQIDDVRIFNYALTSTQVKNLYNGGAVRYGPAFGPP